MAALFGLRNLLYNVPSENLQVGPPLRAFGGIANVPVPASGQATGFIKVQGPSALQEDQGILFEAVVLQLWASTTGLTVMSASGIFNAYDINNSVSTFGFAQNVATGLNITADGAPLLLVLQMVEPVIQQLDVAWAATTPPTRLISPLNLRDFGIVFAINNTSATAGSVGNAMRIKYRIISGIREG